MKSILSLILTATLLCGFTACGQNVDSPLTLNNASTIMTVASELANEIDKMPLYSEMFTAFSANTVTALSSDLQSDSTANLTPVYYYRDDATDTGDGIYWHEDLLPEDFDPSVDNQYSHSELTVNVETIDSYVTSIQKTKDKALASCKELDVWVEENSDITLPIPPGLTPDRSNQRYRIRYDVNTDTVTVESLCDEYSGLIYYSCFTVSYNPLDKLKVESDVK